MFQRIAILGASARAAAESACLADWTPSAADLFGDRDLIAIADWVPVNGYPQGLYAAATRLPHSPWIYTGGLENHPDLVDHIGQTRPLLGNAGDVLRAVRDPWRLASCLEQHGFHCPPLTREPPDGSGPDIWLIKPLKSCGGHGIRVYTGSRRASHAAAEGYYFQQFVAGTSCAAVYVAARQQARLLGVTRQLVGEPWAGGRPFAYCGSIGPLTLSPATSQTFHEIGNCLAATFGLTGVFGVDAISDGQGVHVLEVNPRYTASVEVLERALNRALLGDHLAACRQGVLPERLDSTARHCGKAVIYADTDLAVTRELCRRIDAPNRGQPWPPLADLPCPGTRIVSGRPALTVRAEGSNSCDVQAKLRLLAAAVRSLLADQGRE